MCDCNGYIAVIWIGGIDMTFKEKLAKEHPEQLDNECAGGCVGCPRDYGYEQQCNTELTCEECWNGEIFGTLPTMTAEETWELVKKIYEFPCDELETIFGVKYGFYDLISKFTPQEAKAKLEEWESKQIQVGDVVTTVNGCAEHLVLRVEHSPKQILHVCNVANGTVQTMTCEVKKTGKHIDIQAVLDQIGGGNND